MEEKKYTMAELLAEEGDNRQSSLCRLYPCGEGAGYAGGITSCALDGINVALAIAHTFNL